MEKQTVFIKRYPSKGELPKVDNREYLTDKGLLKFERGEWFSWWQSDQYTPAYPNFYLEEIELPSEEDVQSQYEANAIANRIDKSKCDWMYYVNGWKHSYNFILNHLK